jgi:sulfite exporter TauE/SafE
MSGAFNLFDPAHSSVAADLLTAFVLGLVHGITPDEHTWPITFSYAIGAYSTWRGFRAGLIFSLAFAVQQAFASELAYFGLAPWLDFAPLHHVVDLVVGAVMIAGGLFVVGRGALPHLHLRLPGTPQFGLADGTARELKPWMPAVHGFVAGWGIDAFSVIVFATLAPAMPSAATGWLPGFAFGIGTLCVQATAGAMFGFWAARRGLPSEAIRSIALTTAARTLLWGGGGFILFGILGLTFPAVAEFEIPTHIPSLHSIGLPFMLVVFTVIGVGVTTFVSATQAWRRRLGAENAAPVPLKP